MLIQEPRLFQFFDGENYDFWSIKIWTIFRALWLCKFFNVGFVEPQNPEQLEAAPTKALKNSHEKEADAL